MLQQEVGRVGVETEEWEDAGEREQKEKNRELLIGSTQTVLCRSHKLIVSFPDPGPAIASWVGYGNKLNRTSLYRTHSTVPHPHLLQTIVLGQLRQYCDSAKAKILEG